MRKQAISFQTFLRVQEQWPKGWFSLAELLKSDDALQADISNLPTMSELAMIRKITVELLNPLRVRWGGPLTVTSGFREPELNHRIGGSPTSDHLYQIGGAADLVPVDATEAGLVDFLEFVVEMAVAGAADGKNERIDPPSIPPHSGGREETPPPPPASGGEIEFDQLIIEPGWVHIGWRPNGNRFQVKRMMLVGGKNIYEEYRP